MSIADFSAAIKAQAYKNWFNRISTNTILKSSAKDLRKSDDSDKSKNSFYINEKNIVDILVALTGSSDSTTVASIFNKLKTTIYDRNRRAIELEPYSDDTGKILYFPRVTFSMVSRILDQALREKIGGTKFSDTFQLGHVYGLFPKKIGQISESLASSNTIDSKSKHDLLSLLESVEQDLYKQDIESSNIKDRKFGLYSKYEKNRNKYLIEVQLKSENKAAGDKQQPLSAALRKFFNPKKVTIDSSGQVKFNTSLVGDRYFLERLVDTKGSPSMADLLALSVKEALQGKKQSNTTYSIPSTKVASLVDKVDTRKLKANIASDKKKIRSIKDKIKSIPESTNTISLVSLLSIIQSNINEQVALNMGDGTRKDILNYRTGRFAESVEVQRLTQSREGTISAFYTYMKYPYATFSEGGKQQFPKTRDPKLLISKSIRDIASKVVVNRMRSVLV